MGWSQYNIYGFVVNSNSYLFAPTELVAVSGPAWTESVNQTVQEAEDGSIKVLTLDANVRREYVFAINRMPWEDRVVGSLTIRGVNSLLTMIRTDANYRENTIAFYDRTTTKGATKDADVRFWASSFGVELARRIGASAVGDPGDVYFGSGRETITFREDI